MRISLKIHCSVLFWYTVMRIITFEEIVDFVGDFSRPLKEGSLAMENIVSFGVCNDATQDNGSTHFLALCMSSMNPKKKPYEVNVHIGEGQLECSCSCVAKELGHCKHVVGFLMLLER